MKIDKYKRARKIVKGIDKDPEKYLIIHYSCESFYDITDGKTPRITAIAVRYYETGQTDIFSIHKTAEKKGISLNDIDSKYDMLEKEMLKEFFDFVKQHSAYKWLHWNMRDINYGFKAIEHRYEVLKGKPYILQDENKIDISRLLIDLYGVGYISHPRLPKLMDKNNIRPKDFLEGGDEAIAFQNKEYIKLHQSTLRKVDVLSNIVDRCANNTLKTNAKFIEKYGLTPQGIYYMIKDNWVAQLLVWAFSMVASGFVGVIITNLMNK